MVRARTAVDFPVPLRPQMRTPPIDGSMALRMRARRMFCCPTIALNGNVAMFMLSSSVQRCIGYTSSYIPTLPNPRVLHAITWLCFVSKVCSLHSVRLSRQIAGIDRQCAACQMTSFVRCQPQYGCANCFWWQQAAIRKEIELIH